MISEAFEFHRPGTLAEAAELLREFAGDVTVLGGGTMLIPLMSANQVSWKHVIGLSQLNLDAITLEDTHVQIGAMTTYAQLLASPIVADYLPLLRMMAEQVTGGPSIWNQGTVGGSASFANPASDAPTCLSVMGASLSLHSADGTRCVPSSEYFLGAFQTARRPDEFLTHIHIPLGEGSAVWRYQKYKSCTSSWPIVTVACAAQSGEVRIGVGASTPCPVVISRSLPPEGPEDVDGWINSIIAEALKLMGDGWSDELADASYRRAVVPAAVRRNLRSLIEEVCV